MEPNSPHRPPEPARPNDITPTSEPHSVRHDPNSITHHPVTHPTVHASLTPRSESTTSSGKHQGLRDLLSVVAVLACALLLAFGLISFVFQSYEVDGPSMESTLQNNDHLIVWKVPRTIARVTKHTYIPNRGDVIIFNEPGLADFGSTQSKQLIKRVIGRPGDRVVVKDGAITIYNTANPAGFQPDKTLPYGTVIGNTSGTIDITLKDNEVFACGDNRSNSLDSRVFGPVDANNIVGKLVVRVLPLNTFKSF